MTHVHYKFSSKRSYNTVVFDGVNITLCELKWLIMSREKLRAADCDLQITNAQTKEEYTDSEGQIPKGSSVIVRRVPSSAGKSSSSAKNSQRSEVYNYNSGFFKAPKDGQKSTGVLPIFSQMADLSSAAVSEDDKIKTIMNQCLYDSSNYQKYGTPLPANYTCYRCGSSEHHIRNCPMSVDKNAEPAVRIKKSTGIPRSFMVKVDDPSIKGAMLTNTGDYAVPAIDAEVYAVEKKKIPAQELLTEDPPEAIPDELLCLICKDLLNDAVVIPCCGNSYCDECIRSALLDSEDHICPTCSQPDVSPDNLVANKFLRQAVNNFTKEQIGTQGFKSTPNASRSQDCTPRPSPAPTPPPQSQPEKPNVTDLCTVISSDSPPSSASTTLNVVKVLDETSEKQALEREADVKKSTSPEASPAVLVSDTNICVSQSQPVALNNSVTEAVADESISESTPQSDQGPDWDRSTSKNLSEGWTAISAHPPASSSSTFSVPPPISITSPHFQTYLQQQPLSIYPPAFSTSTPQWTVGPSPQGAPIPTFISSPSPSIPPLLPKELMLYHRRNQERTPPRGSSYSASCSYSSKSRKSKSSHSSSRSPSRSGSHDRTRHYSPYSSHRGLSSSSHSSRSYSHTYKRPRSPTTTSSPSPHSRHRSRSPSDRRKSRHHGHHHNSSISPRRKKERDTCELNYDTYLRWKQEYTEWCEKYFNTYFSHFHQMPPPPLMPPPQPHWSNHSPNRHRHHHHHRAQSPPSSDSRSSNSQSYSEQSSATTRSSSSYSDSTPTQSFSDSNSPQSDDCSRASHKSGKVDEKQNKAKEGRKQKIESSVCLKSPPKKTDKHRRKVETKKNKDVKRTDKEKDRHRSEKQVEKHYKAKVSEKKSRTAPDRRRQAGHDKSPDSRSDKSTARKDEETLQYQRQNIQIESSSSSDIFPKGLEREKPKKAVWKPQPLTKENAWEGGVKVKPQKKINININFDSKKNGEDGIDVAESYATPGAESCTVGNQIYNQVKAEPSTPNDGTKDVKNDSWDFFPDDETIAGEETDLWQSALTVMEEEDGKEEKQEKSVWAREDDRNHEGPSMIIDNNCLKTEQVEDVTTCQEQQKAVVKAPVEERPSMEKHTGHFKRPCSRRETDGFEKDQPAKVSSHLREGRGKSKRRLVEVDNTEERDDSAGLNDTVAPSSGRNATDSGFNSDRKEKKKAEQGSQHGKGEESRHHKERESYGTLNRKPSNGSSRAFTFILDAEKYSRRREPDESKEGKSGKINMETDLDLKGKNAYSRHYYYDSQQDPKVHNNCSNSQPDRRDKGQLPSRTSTEDHHRQNWTRSSPAPPSAESSRGTASDPEKTRDKEEKERKRDKKKQKSHKREKRHSSSDE